MGRSVIGAHKLSLNEMTLGSTICNNWAELHALRSVIGAHDVSHNGMVCGRSARRKL